MILRVIFALLALLLLSSCGSEEAKDESFKEGEEIVLTGIDGSAKTLVRAQNAFYLKENPQKAILIDIFGTFCPPCQKEAPELTKLAIELKDKIELIGLIHLEKIENSRIESDFVKKYNAYYFISNETEKNTRLIEQIAKDIEYKKEIVLPFKVLLKNKAYQEVTDFWVDAGRQKYYLGKVPTSLIRSDLK